MVERSDAGARLLSEALHATAEMLFPVEDWFVNQARSVDRAA
jgi:hypothetical protein